MELTEREKQLFETINNLTKMVGGLLDLIYDLLHLHVESRKYSDAAIVLASTQVLKEQIGAAIHTQVSSLNRRTIRQLYGASPLPKGSPKGLAVYIEVAHVLGMLDVNSYNTAVKIKNVRDVFAHNMTLISLDKGKALTEFRLLHKNPEFKGKYIEIFLKYVMTVSARLEEYVSSQSSKVKTQSTISGFASRTVD